VGIEPIPVTPQPPLERTEPEPPVATTTPPTVAETSSTTERQAQTEEVARAASSTSDPEAMKVPPPSPVMPTEARTSPRVNFLLISFTGKALTATTTPTATATSSHYSNLRER
jgi:hypothetical protein